MANYPYARVAHLLGMDAPYTGEYYGHKSTTTPTTLTGSPQSLYSYQLCIMFHDKRGAWLHARNSSPTTNRHIDAVQSVLGFNGYVKTDETRFLKRGMGHADGPYTLLVKPDVV